MTIDTDFLTQKPYNTYICKECNKEISRMMIDKAEDICPVCSNRKENNEANI